MCESFKEWFQPVSNFSIGHFLSASHSKSCCSLSPCMLQTEDDSTEPVCISVSVMGTSSGRSGGTVLLASRLFRIQSGKPSKPDTRSKTPAMIKQASADFVVSNSRPATSNRNSHCHIWTTGRVPVTSQQQEESLSPLNSRKSHCHISTTGRVNVISQQHRAKYCHVQPQKVPNTARCSTNRKYNTVAPSNNRNGPTLLYVATESIKHCRT